jgi:pyruvate dehydrogenase E1 component alpha subunit
MMAELFGKQTGYCKGKGGSMHIADIDIGILGANGIAGGGLPIAVGAAWSSKWRQSKQVAVCFFGDGSSNNGTFHESLNLASVHNLPVVFVCENNEFGISVCQAKHQAIRDVASRAAAYDMPGVIVDGNDIQEVYSAATKAIRRARTGEGPTLIECKTYRWRGHHEGDPNQGTRYRSKEEIEEWKKKCPIAKIEHQILKNNMASKDALKQVDKEIEELINQSVNFAKESDFPSVNEMYEDIYVNGRL